MALIGDLQPYFNEFARNLRVLSQQACKNANGSGNVTVVNPAATPVNVTIVPPTAPVTNVTSAGTTSPIPAGFKSVTIVKTSANTDTVTVTLSDASTYALTEQGESLTNTALPNGVLPTYILAGAGTFKWYGIK